MFCLKYIEVDVEGLSDTVIALNDSGCQLCAVNADTVRSLDLPIFGQVKLRGISDHHLMPADVVKIRVRLTTAKRFVNITCAVVEKLNYSLILASDIVDRLNQELMDENFVENEMLNVVHENNDGDDDDVDGLRLRAYRVPENLKPMVEAQINELLKLGIIKPPKMIIVTMMKVKMKICLIHEKRLQRY